MGRAPCCDKVGLKKGPWTPEEDHMLITFIQKHGHANWRALPKEAGLLRCGKSCRLRWINYLRPDVKRGNFSREEEDIIIQLHEMMGNRWSAIAARLPGRTDNEIKNMWHTHFKKRLNKQYQTTKLQHINVTALTTVESTSSENDSKRSDHFTLSPQQSYATSENVSSVLIDEVSSVENFNYNNVIEDTQIFENSIEFMTSLEYLPIIDETFWEPQEKLKLDDNNCNISSEFSNVIMEGNQLESLLREENYYDENLDFWLDVFVHAGGAHQQTEFEDP